MKTKIITTILVLFVSTCVCAEDKAPAKSDPFDLSQNDKKIKELGIPTFPKVLELERKAIELYQAKDWKAAAEASAEYARAANWLSNIIGAGLEPYYGASYDDRKDFNRDLKTLIKFEGMMNDLRKKRNRAMVIQAECVINAGDKEKGLSLLLKALDLIDINNTEYWEKARAMLYSMAEIK